MSSTSIVSIEQVDDGVRVLDQTRLPLEEAYVVLNSVALICDAIKRLVVRGAPLIGVTAAYGAWIACRETMAANGGKLTPELLAPRLKLIRESRPTAVNLMWAIDRVAAVAADKSGQGLLDAVLHEAKAIHREDRQMCDRMGEHGASLITPGCSIITICNTGRLATAGIGTAVAPIFTAHARGIPFRVFALETRPLLQGARLTAFELKREGIDVTLITDNMAAHIIEDENISIAFSGADRIAANGDSANKIGTKGLSIICKHFGVPFYVVAPSSTLDLKTPSGAEIPIEERATTEVTAPRGVQWAPTGVKVRNPAFDVAPNALIAGIITEKGIHRAPYINSLQNAL